MLFIRMTPEESGLTDKLIQDAIGLCLNKTEKQFDLDFKGPVVVEAMDKLLSDGNSNPPLQIMRTMLLACRVMPEVMRYMLSQAVPKLIKAKSWNTAPRVWDGVLHCIKKYSSASQRDGVESLLRSVLGLPVKQLNVVLQVCGTDLKAALKNTMTTFSAAEKDEVISGKWVGLEIVGAVEVAEKLALLDS
jgi:hypothetical protein